MTKNNTEFQGQIAKYRIYENLDNNKFQIKRNSWLWGWIWCTEEHLVGRHMTEMTFLISFDNYNDAVKWVEEQIDPNRENMILRGQF